MDAQSGGPAGPPVSTYQGLDSLSYSALAWIVAAVLAALAIVEVSSGDARGFAVAAASAILVALFASFSRLPRVFDFLVALAALVNGSAFVTGLWDIPYYDGAVHVYMSFTACALFGWWWTHRFGIHPRENFVTLSGMLVLFGVVAGIVWELFEAALIDLEWRDTVNDLIADTVGALAAIIFIASAARPVKRGPM